MWLEQFGGIDELVFYIFCGVSGLILILSLINLIVGCCLGKNSVGVSCDFHIEIGCLCLAFTVLARGINVQWTSDGDLDILCEIYHVVLLIGLTQFIGGLFVKGWTVFLFYKYNQEKRPLSEEWIPNLLIWILILIIAAASLVWVFLFRPEMTNDLKCVSGNSFEWKVATSAWHGLLLLLALVAVPASCSVTRGTPGSAEASILAVVTINTLLAVVAGICIHFLYKPVMVEADNYAIVEGGLVGNSKTIIYAIEGGLMLWMCLFADIMFLISKVCGARNASGNEGGDNYDTINSAGNTMTRNNPSFDGTLVNGKSDQAEPFDY